MPRTKLTFLPGFEDAEVNCFAFYKTKAGRPACRALCDIYCLKQYSECSFFATPQQAARAAKLAAVRNAERRRGQK